MAGSVGSNETPQVFPAPISRVPQRFVDAVPSGRMPHALRCRTASRCRSATTRRRRRWASSSAARSADALDRSGTWSATEHDLGQAPLGLHHAHQRAVHLRRAARRLLRRVRVTTTTAPSSIRRRQRRDDRGRAPVASRGVPHRRRRVRLGARRGVPLHLPAELPRPAGHAPPAVPVAAVGDCRTCTRRTGSSTGSPKTCSVTSSRGQRRRRDRRTARDRRHLTGSDAATPTTAKPRRRRPATS